MAATLLANVDVTEGGPGADFPMWQLLAAIGAAVLAAALGLFGARLVPAPQDPAVPTGARTAHGSRWRKARSPAGRAVPVPGGWRCACSYCPPVRSWSWPRPTGRPHSRCWSSACSC
ncbi:hypothetical protein NKH18_34335 [Streptomyces sp. M10(2022)]